MTKVRFRFATDILRRLGEELNPSLDQSIIELVKNAHDADATTCVVSLDGVSRPGGTLTVVDTGDGMTVDEIVNHFLLLGKSPKTGRKRTRSGRVLAGSKGLGRLAALRAGTSMTLTTRPRKERDVEHRLEVNWSDFDGAETVDDVPLSVTTQARPAEALQGTTIEVHNLSRKIGKREVTRLARALLLLADPYGDDVTGFQPVLDSEEFAELAQLVEKRYFDDAEYHLEAQVDTSGISSATVFDWRGESLFRAEHRDLRGSEDPYDCPPAQFDLWVFILSAKTFQTRSSSLKEVTAWLSQFGGAMLYLNGIRVPPYGDPNNDWLDINLQRNRSPEERPGTHTSLGRVKVDDRKGILEAKTDRSGMIESPPFLDLRQMAQDALEWMAKERLKVAEQRRQQARTAAPAKTSKSKENVLQAISDAGSSAPQIREAFSNYEKAREREIKALQDEVQLYRTLSTAGITAATFAHESSGGPLKIIGRAVSTVRRRVKTHIEPVPGDISEPLNSIQMSASSLAAFSDTTLDLVDRDKRRAARVDLHAVLSDISEAYRPFLEARDADLVLELTPANPYLRASIAAIESIVVNLLTNALTALSESTTSDRRVEIITTLEDSALLLSIADNGPGLDAFDADEVWLPGVTSRPGGSGLGLTIVKDTVADLGGRVSVVPTGRIGGAEFNIYIPVIGS